MIHEELLYSDMVQVHLPHKMWFKFETEGVRAPFFQSDLGTKGAELRGTARIRLMAPDCHIGAPCRMAPWYLTAAIRSGQNPERRLYWHTVLSATVLPTYFCGYMLNKEYWMIDREPGFFAVVWFDSSPTPYCPILSVRSTSDRQED